MNPEAGFVGDVRERIDRLTAGNRGASCDVAEIIKRALDELGYGRPLETRLPLQSDRFQFPENQESTKP